MFSSFFMICAPSAVASFIDKFSPSNTAELDDTSKKSITVLFPSKQIVYSLASKTMNFLYHCDNILDKITYCAFVVFFSLSWILDSAFFPRLPGRLVLLWVSRGITLILAGYMKEHIRFGANVDRQEELCSHLEKRDISLNSVSQNLNKTRKGFESLIDEEDATLQHLQRNALGFKEAASDINHTADALHSLIGTMNSDLTRMEAANAEESRLQIEARAIIEEHNTAAKRMEKAFGTMQLALSLAMIPPMARQNPRPMLYRGRFITPQYLLHTMQIAQTAFGAKT